VEKFGIAGKALDDNITGRMRCTWCTTKARNTHSERVKITAFPWQRWLHERASMLRILPACLRPRWRWEL